MQHFIKTISLSASLCAALASCSLTPYTEEEKSKPLLPKESEKQFLPERSNTYVREVDTQQSLLNSRITLVGQVSLLQAITRQIPYVNILPKDSRIDLTRKVMVHANNLMLKDYLAYLSVMSGYNLELVGTTVTIESFVRKDWNLATFASARQAHLRLSTDMETGSSDSKTSPGSASISNIYENDEWANILESAKNILGIDDEQDDEQTKKEQTPQTSANGQVMQEKVGIDQDPEQDERLFEPYINGLRSIGSVSAGGSPVRMQILDDFLSAAAKSSQRQVNIDVQAYFVTLSDTQAKGIDWSKIQYTQSATNFITGGFSGLVGGTSELASSAGNLNVGGSWSDGRWSIKDGFIQFLSEYGTVDLIDQPNITVRNGTYAYIHAGNEFSYIAEIKNERFDNTARETSSVQVDRIKVGVTLSVIPRILEGDRILLDIWPVVSNVDANGTNISIKSEFGEQTIGAPEINMQELSTEVITQNGRPIHLGGLIQKKIAQQLNSLPWMDRNGSPLDPLFSNEGQLLERRELVLLVTPTIIEGNL